MGDEGGRRRSKQRCGDREADAGREDELSEDAIAPGEDVVVVDEGVCVGRGGWIAALQTEC